MYVVGVYTYFADVYEAAKKLFVAERCDGILSLVSCCIFYYSGKSLAFSQWIRGEKGTTYPHP